MSGVAVKRPDREELAKLRARCVTLGEIGKLYGVSRSLAKKWCRDLAIMSSPKINSRHRFSTIADRRLTYGDDGISITERARKILGKRVEERRGAYHLDGRPVDVAALIAAAGLSYPRGEQDVR